jgi:hypothetical protein
VIGSYTAPSKGEPASPIGSEARREQEVVHRTTNLEVMLDVERPMVDR